MRVLKKKQERLSVDGELPQVPSTTEYVMSKVGKEFKDAHLWILENNTIYSLMYVSNGVLLINK
jgi:hypothetical protein